MAYTMLFPYSKSYLAMVLSKETSESFGSDFVGIFEYIAESVKMMLRREIDQAEDMNERNEGKCSALHTCLSI